LALHGDLGAGKTTLVRAMASGLGVSDAFAVTSPTYALVHQYETASGTVVHADFYRVRRPAELDELGWDEMLAGARAAIVEWPEQAEDRLPADAVHLALSHVVGAPGVRALHRLR
jgi:tRNA threonylcarbamoyl adenosine modification protein YjeE